MLEEPESRRCPRCGAAPDSSQYFWAAGVFNEVREQKCPNRCSERLTMAQL
jgi:hypothetical protein